MGELFSLRMQVSCWSQGSIREVKKMTTVSQRGKLAGVPWGGLGLHSPPPFTPDVDAFRCRAAVTTKTTSRGQRSQHCSPSSGVYKDFFLFFCNFPGTLDGVIQMSHSGPRTGQSFIFQTFTSYESLYQLLPDVKRSFSGQG